MTGGSDARLELLSARYLEVVDAGVSRNRRPGRVDLDDQIEHREAVGVGRERSKVESFALDERVQRDREASVDRRQRLAVSVSIGATTNA